MEMKKEIRLIDANALKAHINGVSTHWLNDWSTLGVLAAVDKQPTVDAVEVVRCKDCRFRIDRKDGTHGCYRHFMEECKTDDFCSYGERKDNERKAD